MDYSNAEIVQVKEEDKDIIKNLFPLFAHDISEYDEDEDVDSRGRFAIEFLDMYWKEQDLIPLLINVKGRIAGFILLQTGKYAPPSKEDYYIGQFFILKRYRRKGIGKEAVRQLFIRYPGKYLIGQLINNIPAIKFWKSAYSYCEVQYSETTESIGKELIVQRIDARKGKQIK